MAEEMSDSEMWQEYRKQSQDKKRRNQINSTKILEGSGVKFISHNGGNHLEIPIEDDIIDFWPSTGKFIARKSQDGGRGVLNLFELIKDK